MSIDDEFIPAGDLLEEHGFDEVAKFIRTGVHGDDHDDVCSQLENAKKEAEALQERLDGLDYMIDETRDRYSSGRYTMESRLSDLIAEWTGRGEEIEELKARVAELERELADADR